MSKNDEELKKIKDELVANTSISLYSYRTENNYFPVIGEGNHEAKIMFVGEAPGQNEAKQGRPFCGAAGKMLDKLLAHIDLKRENVYITNIVKDRPPDNRDPSDEEILAYAPYLVRQIEIIKPNVVCALGRHSMKFIMEKYGLLGKLNSISKIHGQIFETKDFKFVPLYHPAVALYNGGMRETLEKDFEVLKKILGS